MGKLILIVSSDKGLYQHLQRILRDHTINFYVMEPASITMMGRDQSIYSLLIWDRDQVELGWIHIFQAIREANSFGIVILYNDLSSSEIDSLFQNGILPMLPKPGDAKMSAAQICVLLHQENEQSESLAHSKSELMIDPRYRIITIDEKPFSATRMEFDLLYFMASRPRQVFSRDQLYKQVWGDEPHPGSDATVKSHITSLRKKLRAVDKYYIQNVWGVGYRFLPPE